MTMDNSGHRKPSSFRGEPLSHRRSWCCSFAVPPSSPDTLSVASRHHNHTRSRQHRAKPDPVEKSGPISVPCSPQSSKSSLNIVGRIGPRRILSPGRVSPIDSDPTFDSIQENSCDAEMVVTDSVPKSRSGSFRAPKIELSVSVAGVSPGPLPNSGAAPDCGSEKVDGFDARLCLKGRNGELLILELSSEILAANSEVFAALIAESKKGPSSSSSPSSFSGFKNTCRIEVSDMVNLGVFRETIELMFENDDCIVKKLMKMGVYRAIDVLEVATGIKFSRAVMSCLRYLEAVPWTEEEEEKLRVVLTMFNFDVAATSEILARLKSNETEGSHQSLSKQLVWSITSGTDANARNELKSLVKGLLCKSSVYEKVQPELSREDIYTACNSCLDSLADLIKEASGTTQTNAEIRQTSKCKPLIERVSRQVDNINWLLEIMVDRQIGEGFVDIWAKERRLVEMHEMASPMVRYELSRVSGVLFIAMGTRKLQCRTETRLGLLEAWYRPMLVDFGWLKRCKKGLDVRQLEEGLGQTLLTLPLKQQYPLFMEWFRRFSKEGTECPNLSKAFQIWWRRSFLRGSETHNVEPR
ncbi:PREDICTED: BTB/POZ domain-containing protein At2g13690 [Tarenaya hassleriana]|uniref:BTB/POZ domain-containing protein At2g13690 n=1 Tax=Tarenaya hassleriana TaxID=28532 RepID=UPI00053C7E68|nr:PREDICTED: BTB/POZ domain-containing protein At2g13690 [Tarenaya hassleriana]